MTTALDVQGRRTILYATNKSGGAVAKGDLVVGDGSNDEGFTTTTTAGLITAWVGVVIEDNGIASNMAGRVCVQGYVSLVTPNASVTRGHFGKTHTVAKQVTDAGASRVTGVFCQFLTSGTTPSAILFGMPDGSTGAAGSPATPALTFSTTNAVGAASTLVASDATIALFDATAPTTSALGDAAAAGSAGVAARRDHRHGRETYDTAHACRVHASATQTVSSGTVPTLMQDTEDIDTDGFHFTSGAALTGTVAKNGTTAIVGTGTLFTSELAVNQVISIPGTATEIGVVASITDNTHLTLVAAMANTASGQTATRQNGFIAIPSGMAGKYRISGGAQWTTVTTSKNDYASLNVNATLTAAGNAIGVAGGTTVTGQPNFINPSTNYALAVGDTVALQFGNNESGTVTLAAVTTHLELELIGV